MNKLLKIILTISATIFGLWFLLIPSTFAQDNGNLVVQFEQTPLFKETNFLPGESVTRWVKVTNNSGTTQRIATEAINYPEPTPDYDLSRALMFIIKQGGTDLYGGLSTTGPKSLYDFYQDSEIYPEIYLSDLGNGETTQYNFMVSFPSEKENEWQGATTTFDILIGFQGTSIPPPSPPSPPPLGPSLPPGLTIQEESVRITTTTEYSVTITWLTSYFSTSQVIYGAEGESHTLDLTDNTGIPPKYGYAHTTPEYDVSPKVTFHSVNINGLTPGKKYYYRTVSHASLAISQEYSFTTLEIKTVEERLTEEKPAEGGILEILKEIPEKIAEVIIPPAPTMETAKGKPLVLGEEFPPSGKEVKQGVLTSLLANIGLAGREISQSLGKTLLFLICLLILLFIFRRERKRREEKKE